VKKTPVVVVLLVAAFCCPMIAPAAEVTPGLGVTTTAGVTLDLTAEWLFQHEQLARQIELREKIFPDRVTSTVFRTESLILPADRDPADVVLRRTAALLDRLAQLPGCEDLADQRRELADLQHRVQSVAVTDGTARKELYLAACKLRRTLTFKNPLLDFDKVLFVKREIHGPTWPEGTHMCDQYFGFHAKPGG